MLLEFRTENYKTFRNKVVFSMKPADKSKDLSYSILHENVDKTPVDALSAAVIYGANAVGKTNLICAMQTFKHIVARGYINNLEDNSNINKCTSLELIPNSGLTEKKDTFFSAEFIYDGFLVKYAIKVDLGKFMDKGYDRSITRETLDINNKMYLKELKTKSL